MNWSRLSVVVVCLTTCGAVMVAAAPHQWCYKQNIYYKKVLQIPQEICRPAFPLSRMRPVPKMAAVPRLSYSVLHQDKVTANQVIGIFPGLFLNKTTASGINTKLKKGDGKKPSIAGFKPTIDSGGRKPLTGNTGNDGDLHCPTFRNLNQAPNNMRNIQNEMTEVVHFPTEGVYQYIHQGNCGSSGMQSCSGGGCFQETSIVYLMVWKDSPDWPTGFEPFEVDSYCSCKAITP